MTLPSVTRAAIRLAVVKAYYAGHYPHTFVAAGTSTTTSLVNTVLSPSGTNEDFFNAWLQVIVKGSGDPELGEVARVTNVNFTGSNSALTVAPALSAAPDSGSAAFEIHRKFHPSVIEDLINDNLEALEQPLYLPVTIVEDGDMEATGISDWTAVGGPSVSKTTTVTRVRHGTQSLVVEATTEGYAQSDSFFMEPGEQVLVSSDVKCLDAGSVARVELWDATNSTRIDYATSDLAGWVTLYFEATVPATCESLQIRLVAEASSAVVFDHVTVLPRAPSNVFLTATVEFFHDVETLYYFDRGQAVTLGSARNAFRIQEQAARMWEGDWSMERSGSPTVPSLIRLGEPDIDQALWMEAKVDFPALTSDTDTTNAPKDLVVGLVYASLIEKQAQEILREDPLARIEWTNLMTAAAEVRKEIAGVYRAFIPDEAAIIGAGRR